MYLGSLALVVLGVLVYQAAQRSLPHDISPFAALALAYGVALFAALAFWGVFELLPQTRALFQTVSTVSAERPMGAPTESLRRLALPAIAIGAGAFFIELGFILMFRSGWLVSQASLSANVAAAILLVPVGVLFFHETITPTQILGFVLGGAGLYLISGR